jgi:hypothetical protein
MSLGFFLTKNFGDFFSGDFFGVFLTKKSGDKFSGIFQFSGIFLLLPVNFILLGGGKTFLFLGPFIWGVGLL